MPKNPGASQPSSNGSSASGRGSKGKMPDWGLKPAHGPKPHEDACISEEVKIGINLAVERFRMNETQKDLDFPTSLTATERAYIHRLADDLGLKHKSRGQNASRHLVISKKKEKTASASNSASFQLVRNSRYLISNMLQRFPITNKERMELLPAMDANQSGDVLKEPGRAAIGRLNNGLPQIPPDRGRSDLTNFTHSLPINQYRNLILETINNNQVCLISGETGSGKTTQVPQMILDDCHANKKPCRIFCTQPRRIAALSISERVAAERGEAVGQTVGFQIRLESRVSPKTLLTYCTNGVLLRTLMGTDSALDTVTHVVVDEVHERDKFCDFLLISLRDLASRNPNLKVILMSATLNIDLFIDYFNNCPAVTVPGNLFPVQEYFLEDVLSWTGYTNKKMEKYKQELDKVNERRANLENWTSDPQFGLKQRRHKKMLLFGNHGDQNDELSDEEQSDTDKEPDDRAELTSQLALLGQEKDKEELDVEVIAEMDQCMANVWLTGTYELFHQVFYFIMSENISVDYQHSETTVTPLMIAAGRGFYDIVEQLLSMEADPGLKSSNGWTALDWAREFKRDDIVSLLETHMLDREASSNTDNNFNEEEEVLEMENEQRDHLSVYQHCWDDDKVDIDLIAILLNTLLITTKPEGAILIFLPGYDDIVSMRNRIEEDELFSNIRYNLYLLHSAMQSTDQKKVFRPSQAGVRKIVLATNIAETSITINDVVYVINSGKVKEKTFDALLQITMLKSTWISKASSSQRKGRAGRVQPGVCYHMFSSVRYRHMFDFATPELIRCPLQELCLQTKLLAPSNEDIEAFLAKAPEPPPHMVLRSALTILKQMDALDSNEELTELGRHLADLPVEPHLGKMVLNSIVLKCLDPVLTIVCALSYKDPFILPMQASQRREVHQIRMDFSASTYSDHMALLRVFQAWQKARTDGWERAFCSRNYVSPAVMEMIVGIRAQLLGQLRASGFVRARGGGDIRDLNANSENWAVVKAALCSGAYPSIIRWDKTKKNLVGQSNCKIKIHHTSVVPENPKSLPSDWLLYEEMMRAGGSTYGTLACVRCCAMITPVTVAIFSGPAKLPQDALKDGTQEDGAGENSDSENEEADDNKSQMLQLSDWLCFRIDPECAMLTLQLRQKWQCLFQRRMKTPSKPWSQMDDAVISAVVNVLTNEEQALGLQQPAGIGQRPRPMSAESIMSGGGRGHMSGGRSSGMMDESTEVTRHRFSTSAKKATCTPPKRKDFMSPKLHQSSDGSQHNSPCSSTGYHGSNTNSPLGSPQIGGQGAPAGTSRYFIMKSSSQKCIDMSVSKGAWATSKLNEKRLNKAFQDGHIVYLIYSIQGSGHFQGYGKMSSIIGREKSYDYNGQGGVFSVDWIKRGNIQFQATHNLLNPWNENKRVQISKDGQELEPTVGEALLRLWDRFPDYTGDSEEVWPRGEPVNDRGQYVQAQGQGQHHHGNNDYDGRLYSDFEGQGHFHGNHYQQQYKNNGNYGNQQFQTWGNYNNSAQNRRFAYNHHGGQRHYGNHGNQHRGQGHMYGGYQGHGNFGYQGQEVRYQQMGNYGYMDQSGARFHHM